MFSSHSQAMFNCTCLQSLCVCVCVCVRACACVRACVRAYAYPCKFCFVPRRVRIGEIYAHKLSLPDRPVLQGLSRAIPAHQEDRPGERPTSRLCNVTTTSQTDTMLVLL